MWIYNNKEVIELPDDVVGFVYLITNTTNDKKYIGKKLAKFSKTRYKMMTLKNGKRVKKKIKSRVDSDWLTYYGSSDALTKDIELLGVQSFHREILRMCYSKSECSYYEAKEQFYNGVLESHDWYNAQISVRCHKSHIVAKKQQSGTPKIPLDISTI
jgi:hypothetical protein